ncbi:hypothetical protein CYLTODRAFT_458252 [Cylindrobasidium torrendii FP15055 ss-10]|uniref:Uncharacterized protein n=1 Tax=Cylindrobasidium torrendii FP15055 ss-10 TaxID=1314674 RepID=A0A0D7B199_9AGAR|nr:hypothetical protein CYLTODRAFT_458252 [Cylindrobasidium torrendii FP15055 ss-10]
MSDSDAYILQAIRKELPSLTDDLCIHEQESEVDSLEHQVQAFEATFHRTLAAPIHKLPQELLVVIFRFCIPPDNDDLAPLCSNVRWVLLRVCRSWKYALEETPALWTNIVISPDVRPMTRALELYLSFSSQCPLWITICEYEDGPAFRDNWCTAFWEVLRSAMYRWQRLRMHFELTPIDDIIMRLIPLELPMLEEVYIQSGGRDVDPGELASGEERSWFRDAPRLECAHLSFIEKRSYAWYPQSVTHILTAQMNGDMLAWALLSFPDLLELTFDQEMYTGSIPTFEPIHHDNLKYLRCSGLTLRYMTLPALESLTIVDFEDYLDMKEHLDISWADTMTALIHRSKCRLTDLHIVDCLFQEKRTYTELLPLLAPTLVSLELAPSQYSHTEELVRSLTRTESSSGSLPYLENLEIISYPLEEQEDHGSDSFVDVLATALISLRNEVLANKWHASLLKKATFAHRNDPFVVKMRMACLDSLPSRGLDVLYTPYSAPDERVLANWHNFWADPSKR